MRKFFCDKCGKEMPTDRRNVLTYNFNSYGKITSYQSGPRHLDICDECLKEVEKLGNTKVEKYEDTDDDLTEDEDD